MSGGHFNDAGYVYYRVDQFADELERDIENNDVPDEWGYSRDLQADTLEYLRAKVTELRNLAQVMRHIDYLYSGDHGEESFKSSVLEVDGENWRPSRD
jgi:hypothetical protein